MLGDKEKIDRALAMVAAAQAKVEPDSVYGKVDQRVADFALKLRAFAKAADPDPAH